MSAEMALDQHPATANRLLALGRCGLATGLLTALIMTFQPFQLISTATEDAGNAINQLGYSALAAIALLGHLLFADRRVTLTLLRPTWLLMGLCLVLSAVHSMWPDQAIRAALFTITAMVAATGAATLPPDARSFRWCLAIAALAVLGLSYVGVVALPNVAIHQAWEQESQHAGLWRGIYSHKNVAAPIMAALFFCGVYLVRSRQRLPGLLIVILSGFFVYKTGSKTTIALLPAVAGLVFMTRAFGSRLLPVVVLSLTLIGMALFTIGTVISPTLDGVVQAISPGTTFTGRTDLWRFALDLWQGHHWTGFGFQSFWQSPLMLHADPRIELSWDPAGSVNGHDGYLDIALMLGWPGLAIAVLMLVVQPFRDYVRCANAEENRRAADLWLMILAFMLMNAFMESFFFARGNPIWMLTFLAIVELRLLARHPIEAETAAAGRQDQA
ncbi:O-antigen ligase family protein [Consotaella aegiceratis]|uniref:O-antigen ligase family protein n=1 Tax=Consotaella aegiceratis TaxID=3097961 RepID=UPI002F41F749